MNYVGIDWAYGRAAWCARSESGAIDGEGLIPADEDGLVHLAEARARGQGLRRDDGAIWVKDQLELAGWSVEVANARKVRDIAPLACKTDKVDARVLAELCRRDLVPVVWVASPEDRAIRERLRRRAHLVKLRTSARNRIFGLLTQFGLRVSFTRLCQPGAMELLEQRGVRRSGATRSPPTCSRSMSSISGSPRSTVSLPRSPARIRGPSCCRRSRGSAP